MRRWIVATSLKFRLLVLAAAAGLLMLLAAACGSSTGPAASSPSGSTAGVVLDTDFGRMDFSRSTRVDNRWLPLTPGMQLAYVGKVTVNGKRLPHRVVFTVTDLTKMIDGVRTVVIHNADYVSGRLAEVELAFMAQDASGNVWLMGEYPELHKGPKFLAAPDTWIAGVAGARPGILMPADPHLDMPAFLQGWAPKIGFADRARVIKAGQETIVPAGTFHDVLVTEEGDPSDPAGRQLKYYAAGVGNVRVGANSLDKEQEGLVLVTARHLGPAALTAVRKDSLVLEGRAYSASNAVYGRTPRVEQLCNVSDR